MAVICYRCLRVLKNDFFFFFFTPSELFLSLFSFLSSFPFQILIFFFFSSRSPSSCVTFCYFLCFSSTEMRSFLSTFLLLHLLLLFVMLRWCVAGILIKKWKVFSFILFCLVFINFIQFFSSSFSPRKWKIENEENFGKEIREKLRDF